MKTKHIATITLSLLMTSLVHAVTFNVINQSGKNILILPERSKPEEYEILLPRKDMNISSTFHAIKTLRWAQKNTTGSWDVYTANIDLPLSPFTYGSITIQAGGRYGNQLHKNTFVADKQAPMTTENHSVWPQRINEGIFTN